jgi:hypothetical protein
MIGPKIVQSFSGKRSITHDTLGLRPIDDLPCLAELAPARKSFAQNRLETPSTPDPLHKKRLENEGLIQLKAFHRGCLYTVATAVPDAFVFLGRGIKLVVMAHL